MAEYIERERAKEHLIGDYAYAAAKMLDDIPTADVVEVKHGEWVVEAYDDDNRMMIIPYIEHQHSDPFCSNCGKRALLNGAEDYVTSNYCPNCGAKMDLKEGAEE